MMCGMNENTGRIALSDTFSIRANMPRKQLQKGLEDHTKKSCFVDDPQCVGVLKSHVFSIGDTKAACTCFMHSEMLRAITFHVNGGTAAEQRESLFHLIGAQDPSHENMYSVLVRYPFGTAWIATDPRSGDASLRITYAVKE